MTEHNEKQIYKQQETGNNHVKNILFICNKSPWPPKEGGPIAMNNLIEGLIDAGCNVKVLAINTNKYSVKREDIPEHYRKKTSIEFQYIDLSVKPVPAFFNLFTNKSYHVQRFISENFKKLLIKTLESRKFDIVQIETLFMSPYIGTIRKYSDAKIVLRAHNIEHLIWKRLWQTEKNPFKKAYLKHLYKTLQRYELNVLNRYDGIVPITEKDALFFKRNSKTPVISISFGIDIQKLKPFIKPPKEHALFHIGAMNWMPNQEGIKWFLDRVWKEVLREVPQTKLYLAGREMPDWLKNLNETNVNIVGEVDNAYDFMSRYTVSIAPLLSGSGIRIKIIESMAMGKAVISTTVGAEGIEYENGKNIIIADTPDEFAMAVKKLITDKEYCYYIGKNASKLISEKHVNKNLILDLLAFYDKIL